MSERGVGKPWTTYEDNLLVQAVAIHGENDNWKAVASLVPGRTNKACRKRWLHSLSPNVKKTAWTPEEDQLLLSLYAFHGTKWSVIARHIPGRTDDACSKRYREALDPSLKRDDWTGDEDANLLEAYSRLGGKWGLIGQELNRSGLGCRNRWRMLERRRAALSREPVPHGESSLAVPGPSSTSSQWTPAHAVESPYWDGRSPQYVTPAALYQGSPYRSQESHTTSYSPEQILSGAHLNRSSHDPPPFQYPSAFDIVPSHPNSSAHSPEPHRLYSTPEISPSHGPSELSDVNVPPAATRSESPNYEFIPIDGQHEGSDLETYRHGNGHTTAPITSANEFSAHPSPSEPVVAPDSVLPSDSPSPPGSPPLSCSPTISSTSQFAALASITDVTHDNTNASRSYYCSEAEKALRTPPTRKTRNPQLPVRLSSSLPATTGAGVLAYACGHRDCWPDGDTRSKYTSATSKELSDHSRSHHNGDLGGSKPFRCGLTGCEKSWKSINGLQYHLQISKYHFQQALATRTEIADLGGAASAPDMPTEGTQTRGQVLASSEVVNPPGAESRDESRDAQTSSASAREVPLEKAGTKKPRRKLHSCPRAGCGKQYKQLSGLRYHLAHGHVDVLPMQLDVVPPTLARMVAEKGCTTRD